MTPRDVIRLRERLVDRDHEILESLRTHRIASTAQLRRLHFHRPFASTAAASRATTRVLNRLEGYGLIVRLDQRIGGARGGSNSLAWQLGATGDRYLAVLHGSDTRRRYTEPRATFLEHTLAVTELAVQLVEHSRAGRFELLDLQSEPGCWRAFLGAHGRREILKPDLYVVTAVDGYEDHWFLELDLGTEHPPVVARKALVYQRYAATGAHQAAHEVFPATVWVVLNESRRAALERALASTPGLSAEVFRVITSEAFRDTIRAGGDPPSGP